MSTKKAQLLAQMQKGFGTLESFGASLKLSFAQRLKIKATIAIVRAYKVLVLPFQKGKMAAIRQELEPFRNIGLHVERTDLEAGPDNHYLTEEEIQYFERNAMLPPFRVMSTEEAADLRQVAEDYFENLQPGASIVGQAVEDIQRRHSQWSINVGGLFGALHLKEYRDLLRKPAIAQRLASLLGKEVLCWRTQFFEKKPGALGTYWHQSSAFRESLGEDKLHPTKDTDLPLLQLTAWTALSDVTVKNGAMRMMMGTYDDGRMEQMYYIAKNNLIWFLAQVPTERLETVLKAVYFSSGDFVRLQFVSEVVIDLLPDLFERGEVVDLEMKAGECVIFSSLNMHAAYPNSTNDQTRFAFVGRCASNHIKILPGRKVATYYTPEGVTEYALPEPFCFQIHGEDTYGYNAVLREG